MVKLTDKNRLSITNPDVAREWDYDKNGDLTPEDVAHASRKKVSWVCPDCKNGYEATVSSRAGKRGTGCPYCAGRRVYIGNCLATLRPDLGKEWHPTLNKKNPYDYTCGSGEEVWWLCPKCQHEWVAPISRRSKGHGCPRCNNSYQCSYPQWVVYYFVKKYFADAENRYLYGISDQKLAEIDIYIPSLKFGIEYDGRYFHKSRKKKDEEKDRFLSQEICLVRIRESGLPNLKTSAHVIERCSDSEASLVDCLKRVFSEIIRSACIGKATRDKMTGEQFNLSEERCEIFSLIDYEILQDSLATKFPQIAKEYHPTRNGNLTPDKVSSGSQQKLWWLCPNCGNPYEAPVYSRTGKRHTGCPYCAGQKVCIGNCIATLRPDLAREWHPNLNKKTPYDYTCGSRHRAYWLCPVCNNSYDSIIYSRTSKKGSGCPYCAGRKVYSGNCLATLRPDLAEEWHPTKNENTPLDYTCSSNQEVWWLCSICKNGYKATINNRTSRKGTGCPYCAGKKVYIGNCLATLRPDLAEEWHPTKNRKTPFDYTCGSNQRAWWLCPECQNEWNAQIFNRARGSKCPCCMKRRRQTFMEEECPA